ncbi:hypothetical protein ACOME3_009716 [Neoechinorhynchus agilis]
MFQSFIVRLVQYPADVKSNNNIGNALNVGGLSMKSILRFCTIFIGSFMLSILITLAILIRTNRYVSQPSRISFELLLGGVSKADHSWHSKRGVLNSQPATSGSNSAIEHDAEYLGAHVNVMDKPLAMDCKYDVSLYVAVMKQSKCVEQYPFIQLRLTLTLVNGNKLKSSRVAQVPRKRRKTVNVEMFKNLMIHGSVTDGGGGGGDGGGGGGCVCGGTSTEINHADKRIKEVTLQIVPNSAQERISRVWIYFKQTDRYQVPFFLKYIVLTSTLVIALSTSTILSFIALTGILATLRTTSHKKTDSSNPKVN